jgi:hypothetical protein
MWYDLPWDSPEFMVVDTFKTSDSDDADKSIEISIQKVAKVGHMVLFMERPFCA